MSIRLLLLQAGPLILLLSSGVSFAVSLALPCAFVEHTIPQLLRLRL
jgi:hypothetical protein